MALFTGNIYKFCISHNFLTNFKNVIKLKHVIQSYNQIQLYSSFTKCIKSYSTFTRSNITNKFDNLERCCKSQWIRCSSNIHTSQNSRKKLRNKSVVLAKIKINQVKLKLQSARKETRRKVQKKIVEIKENVLTVPNALCALRIASTPFLGYLVLSEFYTASLGIFIFAGFTDVVDGYIARNFPNQQSMIGSFLDPAADKLLIATLFLTLTANGLIPVPLTSIIIVRDACLMGAGFYIRYVSLPPPKTISRYFDMSFATARLSPTNISKVNTFLQLVLVGASLAAPVFSYVGHVYLQSLWYITGTTTVLSAASYLYYNNSTYKLFTSPDEKEK